MIHEISPDIYKPEYIKANIKMEDYVLAYKGNGILVKYNENAVTLPRWEECLKNLEIEEKESKYLYYLFEISEENYFLWDRELDYPLYKSMEEVENNKVSPQYFYLSIHEFRELDPVVMVFAGATGYHIRNWKASVRYCGKCGSATKPSDTERAFVCTKCNEIFYPKISPAIIVAITNGDKLLLVRNKRGAYKRPALVSGFVEIGESFEDTVKREVMEEVGLNIKNIRRYKDQPWGISGAHMIGYLAELDGDDTIRLEEDELTEAKWYSREEIPEYRQRLSVGSEMISRFKSGEI